MFGKLVLCFIVCSVQAAPHHHAFHARVVGGSPADITNFPYQLSLEYVGQHFCGAAVLSEYWAITAAHCTRWADIRRVNFRAGSSLSGKGGSLHAAQVIVNHPLFNSFTDDYDVAVVRVATPFVYSATVQPIHLAHNTPLAGTEGVVTGWGYLNETLRVPAPHLMRVELPVVQHAQCDALLRADGGVTSRMLCAGCPEGGRDACQGDSGGPFMVEGRLAGLVSWGDGCGRPKTPGVYTDLALLRPWVANETGIGI